MIKNIYAYVLLLTVVWCCSASLYAGNNTRNTLHQEEVFSLATLPDQRLQEGLAGTFFGKQNNWFVMAGGSAFPNGKPWQNGTKYIANDVMIFSLNAQGKFDLVKHEAALPVPLAEGSYASIPEGLLCIGGQSTDSIVSNVYLVSFDGTTIQVKEYPSLPVAVKNSTATVVGNQVFLVGGESADGRSTNQFLKLDLSQLDRGWQIMPNLPVALSGATLTSQQDGEEISIYAFGGRAKTDNQLTAFYSSVYHFSLSKSEWTQKRPIRVGDEEIPLAVATASSVGGSHILLYGGDTGTTFSKVERAMADGNLALRDTLWMSHPGFNTRILVYNTITDVWFDAGKTSFSPVAVTADISDGAHVYVASGEIRPGVRSPQIIKLYYTSQPSFGWLNYAVLILYFGGMLFLGFFFMKRNENTDDYFKGGGRLPWWAVGVSIFATTLSAITFLSIPAKTYATDWRMLVFNITIILIVPIVVRYFLPFFRRFNLSTAYEYLEIRFNRVVRWLASALFVIFMVSRIAIVLFLPSLALNAVTGFNIYLAIVVMGLVTIIYSTSGGMEAVVWGDVIQGFILVFGALAAFVFMIVGIDGGFAEFWNTSIEFHKFRTLDFTFDFTQPVFWVVLLGGIANSMITYTSDQSIVQRYMSTKDEKTTANSIWLNGILSVPVTLLFFLIGTGLFAFYSHNPQNMMVSNPNIDSVFPQFIVSEMPIGFAGLLIASIFAAAMSTLSSNINSSSAVITSDFFKTIAPKSDFSSQMKVARWSGILCGLLGLGMALVLATWNIASLWDQFNTFLGLLTSGLGALFILGIFFPRVGGKAALIGVIGGLCVLLFIKNHTPISFLLYGLIGMLAGILIAYLVSFIFPNRKVADGFTWSTIHKVPKR